MIFNTQVKSNAKQLSIEFNSSHVYVRDNFVRTVIPATDTDDEHIEWTYDEYYMSDNEYHQILAGNLFGTDQWTDTLRGVERSAKYRIADDMIAKYTTDAIDVEKETLWKQYKAEVRATQEQENYPIEVIYPQEPE